MPVTPDKSGWLHGFGNHGKCPAAFGQRGFWLKV